MKKAISDMLWELIPHENKYVITEKDLLDYITNLQQELEDYKSRIEKAVEYIKTSEGYSQLSGIWEFYGDTDDLIKILRGEDK